MVDLGSGEKREIVDIALSRYACYLIAQNGDPSKDQIAKSPYFINLYPLAWQVYHVDILVSLTDLAHITQQLNNGVFGCTSYAESRTDGVTLDEGR